MTRMTVKIQSNECAALVALAQRELRDPRAQAALIIRNGLERMGLLPDMAQKIHLLHLLWPALQQVE